MTTRDEVYSMFGRAAEAAQLFETDLGSLLLGVRAQQEGWHINSGGEAAQNEWKDINERTLGQLLGRLRKQLPFEDRVVELFTSALSARNGLMHGFFCKHGLAIQTAEGRQIMLDDLVNLHGELFNAWQRASEMADDMDQKLQAEQLESKRT
jgi:hypothetical protein